MKKETFEPRKVNCRYQEYLTDSGMSYRILDALGKHIKTTTLNYVKDYVLNNGFIWIENNLKGFTTKELTLIRLEHFRSEIKRLYKDYPDTQKSIADSPVKTRNIYAAPHKITETEEAEMKYGISFENGTSIYVPERIYNLLPNVETRYINL